MSDNSSSGGGGCLLLLLIATQIVFLILWMAGVITWSAWLVFLPAMILVACVVAYIGIIFGVVAIVGFFAFLFGIIKGIFKVVDRKKREQGLKERKVKSEIQGLGLNERINRAKNVTRR